MTTPGGKPSLLEYRNEGVCHAATKQKKHSQNSSEKTKEECLLSPGAVIQKVENATNRPAAIGHKRSLHRPLLAES